MRPVHTLAVFALATQLAAQCDFTPTIEPAGALLCPFATETLTTQAYDSYQWYKEGVPIPGATQQSLIVGFQADAGYRFRVEGTVNGCTALSDEVLVDGLAFIAPALYTGGDAPRAIEDGGLLRYCDGDTATLTLGEPYTASITWFRDGVPVPGAHAPTLVVTGSGSYTAHAAPGLCPEVVFSVDVTVTMLFDVPEVPTILNVGGVLCASPFSTGYGWFLNGGTEPIAMGTCHEPLQPGSYTARLLTGEECTAPSAPYLYLPTGISGPSAAAPFPVRVHSGALLAERPSNGPVVTHWRILDAQGRVVLSGPFPGATLQVDPGATVTGMLLFQPLYEGQAVAPATRFVLTR